MSLAYRTPTQRWTLHNRLRDEEYARIEAAGETSGEAVPGSTSYHLLPGVLAGEYPASRYDDDPVRLVRFLDAGVQAFFDLTELDERRFSSRALLPYEPLLSELAAQRGLDITYQRFAVRDGAAPARAQMISILDALDAARAAGQTAYVHCKGGIGRTGTVAGCYLVRHGQTPEAALRLIAQRLYHTHMAERLSPEGDEQRALVLRWQPGL
jgi:sugar phosphate isomerase/epimerase